MLLNVHSLAYPVTALGPGRRLALWVAGCPLRCPGCITPELLDPKVGVSVSFDRLAAHVLSLDAALEGLTLSGGEPFTQADALAEFLARLLPERPSWSVIAYSGFRLERLRRMDSGTCRLLARIDVLIDGPYDRRRPQTHPLAGSGNQRVHYLSARGRRMSTEVDALPMGRADFGIGAAHMSLIGVLDVGRRRELHRSLGLDHSGNTNETAP